MISLLFSVIVLFLSITTPTTAFPTYNRSPNTTTPIVLTVTDFYAYEHDDPRYNNYIFFHVSDSRQTYPLEIECYLISNTTYKYRFTDCLGPVTGVGTARFLVTDTELVIRRGWLMNGTDMYVWGQAVQGTYWKEGDNATKQDNGTYYWRDARWNFPISSLW